MKTAIIEFFSGQFNESAIMAMNNEERIYWANNLDVVDKEYFEINYTLDDFLNNINAGPLSSDWRVVSLDYTDIKEGKFVCNKYDFYDLTIRFCAKTHEAERTKEEYQDMANEIYNIASAKFGTDVDVKIHGYYNDVTDYRFDIYVAGDKCKILNNIPCFCTEVGEDIKGMDYCEPEWSMDGNDINQVSYEMDEDEWLVKSTPTAKIITPVNKREYDQAQLDNAIEIANEELAECIGIIRNYTNVHDLYDNANKLGLCLSRDSEDADYVTIYYKSVKFDVINCSDGSGIYIAGDKIDVRDENKVTIWTGVLTEEGVPGVASQDEVNIYLQPDEPTDEDVIDALKKEQTDILCDNYPLDGDGMYCYYVNSEYYVSVIVEHGWDMFAWRIYTKNGGKDKLIASDFSCCLDEDTWLEVFSTDICNFTGTIEAMIELPSSIFNHVINA